MRLAQPAVPYLLTAVFIAAAYPLALAGQLAFDGAVGDALLIREWRFGSRRAVAFAVAHAWSVSVCWALAVWLALKLLRRWLGAAYAGTALATVIVTIGLALAGAAPVVLALLLAACVALEALARGLLPLRRTPCT